MKDRVVTNTIRNIVKSFPRFLSLIVMSALGVFAFAGLMATAPDMINTLDKYLDESEVYDLRLISDKGLDEDDISEISNLEGFLEVEGIKSRDVVAFVGHDERIISINALPSKLNKTTLLTGKLPENTEEIAVEENLLEANNLELGDKIIIKDDGFVNQTVTICGTVKSPLFYNAVNVDANRGVTNIGSGIINYYAYMQPESFTQDYYTVIYAALEGAKEKKTGSKEYKDIIENGKNKLESIKDERELKRLENIRGQADLTLENESKQAKEALLDAKKRLDDAKNQLSEIENKLSDAGSQIEQIRSELEEADLLLKEGQETLNEKQRQIDTGVSQLEDGKKLLDEMSDEISKSSERLSDADHEIEQNENKLRDAQDQIKEAEALIKEKENELYAARSTLDATSYQISEKKNELNDAAQWLAAVRSQLDSKKAELANAKRDLDEASAFIEENNAKAKEGEKRLNEASQILIEKQKSLDEAYIQLEDGKAALEQGEEQIRNGQEAIRGLSEEYNNTISSENLTEQIIDTAAANFGALLERIKEGLERIVGELNAGTLTVEGARIIISEEINKYEPEPDILLRLAVMREVIRMGNDELTKAGNTLDEKRKEYDNGLLAYKEAKDALSAGYDELNNGQDELSKAYAQLDEARLQFESGTAQYNEGLSAIVSAEEEYNKAQEQYDDGEAAIAEASKIYTDGEALYNDGILQLNHAKEELEEKRKQLQDGKKMIEDAKQEYLAGMEMYLSALEQLDSARRDIEENEEMLAQGTDALDLARLEYEDKLKQYNEGRDDFESGLQEYNAGKEQYEKGLSDFNKGLAEYEEGRANFDSEIKKAKEQIENIEKPNWYIYDREGYSTYSDYIDDANSIKNLSRIFPVVFFIVAVLVSLISMSRMVETDRLEIGTLKSLGFTREKVLTKYSAFALTATIIGVTIGGILGLIILPTLIFNIYKMLFDVPGLILGPELLTTLIGVGLAVICVFGAGLYTAARVMQEKPADLLRPKAPKLGKRVLLERVPFIWKNLNFSGKITIRNLFRYKRRGIVTLFGIIGCTALMLSGFGLKDAIVDLPHSQFGEVFTFDSMAYLSGLDDDNSDTNKRIDEIFDREEINDYTTGLRLSAETNDGYNVNLLIVKDSDDFKKISNLKDYKTKEELSLKDGEVIINNKLAKLAGLTAGDEIEFEDINNIKFSYKISAVANNYFEHYVFMNQKTFEEYEKYSTNLVYMDTKEMDKEGEADLSEELLMNPEILNITYTHTLLKNAEDMLKSLDKVVLILIVLAAALSFVVLYNLSNININERKRELATLKVLGFYDREVDSYITRENAIITIAGIILGLVAGYFLTGRVVSTVEIEKAAFINTIKPMSYFFAAGMSGLFTFIVNRITHLSLKKINMIDSLKSVE